MPFVNGVARDAVSVRDRGLAYGDGIFRTLRMRGGHPRHWQQHYGKLAHDCAALAIPVPDEALLRRELAAAACDRADGVVRITITRGDSARGYAPDDHPTTPMRIIVPSPMPQRPQHWTTEGVRVRICTTRATFQPRLAGIKHLNRLDNVLARAEWCDPGIAEGLMLDHRGDLVGGTMSNVFIVERGDLVTPDLSGSGVAGVQRARVLAHATRHKITARMEPVPYTRLLAADEVFLVNSVIGLWPVIAVNDRRWHRGTLGSAIADWLQEED